MHFSGICFKLRSGRNNYEKRFAACACVYVFGLDKIYYTPIRRGQWHPLQYSSLENPMDGGAWWAAVHGVSGSQAWLSNFTFTHWRRRWQPTPVFLPGESQGRGSLVGCRLWGCRVGHDWSDLAAAAANLLLCIFIILISKTGIQILMNRI